MGAASPGGMGAAPPTAWLYHCFSLSLREVEPMLAARGIEVSYETVRECGLRFGRDFANTVKRRRTRPGDKWFLDEVIIRLHSSIMMDGSPNWAICGKEVAYQGMFISH